MIKKLITVFFMFGILSTASFAQLGVVPIAPAKAKDGASGAADGAPISGDRHGNDPISEE